MLHTGKSHIFFKAMYDTSYSFMEESEHSSQVNKSTGTVHKQASCASDSMEKTGFTLKDVKGGIFENIRQN